MQWASQGLPCERLRDSFTHAETTVAGGGVLPEIAWWAEFGTAGGSGRPNKTAYVVSCGSNRVPEGKQFSTIVDKLVNVVTISANTSSGARKVICWRTSVGRIFVEATRRG